MDKARSFNRSKHDLVRTKITHLSRVYFEDGRSWMESNVDGWVTTQSVPPVGIPSFMNPILHRHSRQEEYFVVVSGVGMWTLHRPTGWLSDDIELIHLKAGDKLTIPQWAAHKFENTSTTEDLVIRAYYSREDIYVEDRFFRNTLTYFDDCRKAGVQASLFQAAKFVDDMHITMCVCPGPEWFAKWVDLVFTMVIGTVIGGWLLGYKTSYPEYFDDRKAR